MRTVLVTAPTIEPVSLSEFCEHLRIDPDTLAENMTLYACTAAGSHPVTTGYTLYGTGVNVLGKKALVYLQPVNNGTNGTVDVKIQESDDNVTYTDWTGGTFTQVTESNDTVIQEKEYTGSKAYIRTASKTLVAACEFGTSVLVKEATVAESDLLNALITASRQHAENVTRRALISQTWDGYLDEFPDKDYIELPYGNLQSVTSIKYKDTAGTETTMTVTTEYLVELNGEQRGRIVLPYGCSWPSETLYPSNPITIRFECGYGDAATDVPHAIRAAIKMIGEDLYRNREAQTFTTAGGYVENKAVDRLLASYRLWSF